MIDDRRKRELLDQLFQICDQLEWVVAVPTDDGDDIKAPGLILGDETFIYGILQMMDVPLDVFTTNDEGDIIEGEMPQSIMEKRNKKKESLH